MNATPLAGAMLGLAFAAGALVFPGGKSHGGDEDPRWQDLATGWDSVGEDGAALRIAAIRLTAGAAAGGDRSSGPAGDGGLLGPNRSSDPDDDAPLAARAARVRPCAARCLPSSR